MEVYLRMGQIVVGLADMKIGKGDDELVTYALGSCIGVCMYDKVSGVGGMLHAMLPMADMSTSMFLAQKYVDTGTSYLYKSLCRRGINKNLLRAKIIGGARMFEFGMANSNDDIGTYNVMQARKYLAELNVPVEAEMTGGFVGRTVYFTAGAGQVRIRTTDNKDYCI